MTFLQQEERNFYVLKSGDLDNNIIPTTVHTQRFHEQKNKS